MRAEGLVRQVCKLYKASGLVQGSNPTNPKPQEPPKLSLPSVGVAMKWACGGNPNPEGTDPD